MPNRPNTILITGATDGIGLALARAYHARGERLVLTGRRHPSSLDPAIFTSASYCRVDLAQPYCAQIVQQFLQSRQIDQLDLLIHNAALGAYGPVAQQTPQNIRALVAVNLRAPVALTHALLPMLRPRGKLVFISSVVSALPGPQYAVYGATKAALDGFARSLRTEMRGSVDVQLIYPGATRTGMHRKSGVPASMRWERFPPAEHVAAQIVRAIDSPREAVTIGAGNRLLQLAGRHAADVVDWLAQRRERTAGHR
jgi:short-subunit dehydrogenase